MNNLLSEVDRAINDETVSASRVVALLTRKALRKVGELIESGNEYVALRASSDILDRNPETSKSIKATVTTWNLDSQDAKELAAALVQGARVKEQFTEVAKGDFVRETDNGKGQDGKAALPGSDVRPEAHLERAPASIKVLGSGDAVEAHITESE